MQGEKVTRARKAACVEALRMVKPGMVVGLGSGKTMELLIGELARLAMREDLRLEVIPSSYQVYMVACSLGLEISSLDIHEEVDLTFDSFDQMDTRLNSVKGGGGAMTRERVLCEASRKVVFVGDEWKLVDRLSMPVPLEVLPGTIAFVRKLVRERGGELRVRESGGKVGPVISDNGNVVCDADFGTIEDPGSVEEFLTSIPCVVGHGMFTKYPDVAIIGHPDGRVTRMERG